MFTLAYKQGLNGWFDENDIVPCSRTTAKGNHLSPLSAFLSVTVYTLFNSSNMKSKDRKKRGRYELGGSLTRFSRTQVTCYMLLLVFWLWYELWIDVGERRERRFLPATCLTRWSHYDWLCHLPLCRRRKLERGKRQGHSRVGAVSTNCFFVGSRDPTGNAVHYAIEIYVLTPYAKKKN